MKCLLDDTGSLAYTCKLIFQGSKSMEVPMSWWQIVLIVLGGLFIYFNVGYLSAWYALWFVGRMRGPTGDSKCIMLSWCTFLIFPVTTHRACYSWKDWMCGSSDYVDAYYPESIRIAVCDSGHIERETYYGLVTSFWPLLWGYRIVIVSVLIMWYILRRLALCLWAILTVPTRQILRCKKKTPIKSS